MRPPPLMPEPRGPTRPPAGNRDSNAALFAGLLAAVVGVALVIRVYKLGVLPSGLFGDEAANGYDAYSLLKTGRSLYGDRLPILLLHHGLDYVESMYSYLTVVPVSLLGLSVFSTRIVAAIAGTCTVLTTFLLTRKLFDRHVALVAALLVALSPWHMMFSRIAFRAILLPLLVTLGIYLFLKMLEDRRFALPCGLVFGLSLHTYAVAKLLIPVLLVALLVLYRRPLTLLIRSNRRASIHALAASGLFLVLAFPVYYLSWAGQANRRFMEISIFSEPNSLLVFLRNYALQLDPRFLFFEGDSNPRHSLGGFGQILVGLLPFVILGVGMALRRRTPSLILPPLVFALGNIAPALTNESIPHALRAIGAVPFLEITAAVGLVAFARFVLARRRRTGIILTAAVSGTLALNAGLFLYAYSGKYPAASQPAFQYGMAEAITIAERDSERYEGVILSHRIPGAYVFPLFFAGLDPTEYQEHRTLGKYMIHDGATDGMDVPEGRYLVILRPYETIGDARVKEWIRGAGGAVFLKLVEYEGPGRMAIHIRRDLWGRQKDGASS